VQGLYRTPVPNVPILPANQYIRPGDVLLGYIIEVPFVQLFFHYLLSPTHPCLWLSDNTARLCANMLAISADACSRA
jgi:hypothetical protein